MSMAVTTRVLEFQPTLPSERQTGDSLYTCGFRIGHTVGTVCARFGLVPSRHPTLAETMPLHPHGASADRTVPVHPRLLRPYQPPRPQGVFDREALRRAVLCACSLPLTKRLATRLLRHSLLAELVLAVTSLLALAALGSPVTLDDVLRHLAGLATIAVELLLVTLVGALAAELLLSAAAVVQAALSE